MPSPVTAVGQLGLGLRGFTITTDPRDSAYLSSESQRAKRLRSERPGEVLTREEIRKELWPDNTIVEFEHSISAAMNRLRQALGDSAEDPHYIETLARRGYRWMLPVEGMEDRSIPPRLAFARDSWLWQPPCCLGSG